MLDTHRQGFRVWVCWTPPAGCWTHTGSASGFGCGWTHTGRALGFGCASRADRAEWLHGLAAWVGHSLVPRLLSGAGATAYAWVGQSLVPRLLGGAMTTGL